MITNMIVTGVMMFLLILLVFIGWFYAVQKQPLNNHKGTIIWYMLAAAFIARLVGAASIEGFPADIACFTAWSSTVFEKGIFGFYKHMQDTKSFLDYPPGYMYVLYIVGGLRKLFNISSGSGNLVLLKLPALIADLACGLVIYKLAKEKMSELLACSLVFIYVFNPVIYLNSALWGQVDSVFVLLILVTFYYVYKNNLITSAIYFALAMLVKPQAFLFGPILLWIVIEKLKQDSKMSIVEIMKVIIVGLVTFLVAALPFTAGFGFKFDWLVKLYYTTFNSYLYASVNAFNFFAFFGGNWKQIDDKFWFLTYNTWSNIFIIASVILSGVVYFRAKGYGKKIFLSATIINMALFVMAGKMHERYMMPAIALLMISYVLTGEKRMLYVYGAFSLASYINLAAVLGGGLTEPPIRGFNNNEAVLIIPAILNIVALAYLIYIAFKPQIVKAEQNEGKHQKAQVQKPNNERNNKPLKLEIIQPEKVHTPKIYYILLVILTIVYSCVAFYNLGDNKAPQTYWKNVKGNSVIVTLQNPIMVSRVNVFHGQTITKYRIDVSPDGVNWNFVSDAETGYVFQWVKQDISKEAVKIKITANKPSITAFLHEIAVFEKDNQKPVPIISVVDKDGKDIKELYDEQNIAVYKPTFLNGTYFDEIYHPRTAYENMHNMEPTETSHPPLGKYLIAIGTSIFGMTPFGWRFMGTLFGIMIIPAFYAMAQVLFRNARYSLIAATLMALDFMHFTQTRIATIDSFSIFFIIMMYLFMFKYYRLSFYENDLKTTLKPLLWSGVFFGIGAATKWICIYAGIGLMVIFAISIIKRYMEYKNIKNYKGANLGHIKRIFPKSATITIISAAVFFAVIPFCIYTLAYFPFAFITGNSYSLGDVFTYQKSMFNYHSMLTATHPYGSKWFEWPTMVRPMWYYSGGTPEKNIVSTISAFGNPAIWWVGIIAFWASIAIAVVKKDKRAWLLVIGYMSQFMPWMFVTRVVFIYHYFASVPFIILFIVFVIYHMEQSYPETKKITYAYLGMATLLFAMFYPVISGFEVSKDYIKNFLRWFSSWVFFT